MKCFPYLILLLICSISCTSLENNFATISGTIHVKGIDSITLTNNATKYKKSIAVNNGTFNDTIAIDKIRSFQLIAGKRNAYGLYLQKGDNLNVKIDSLTPSGISFSGTGAAINNYKKAANVFRMKSDEYKLLIKATVIDTISTQGISTIINKYFDDLETLLENAEIEDKNFIAFEKENFGWESKQFKWGYSNYKELIALKDTSTLPPDFLPQNMLGSKPINEDLFINTHAYNTMVRSITLKAARAKIKGKEEFADETIRIVDSILNTIDVIYMKDYLLDKIASNLIASTRYYPKNSKTYFNYFTSRFSEGNYKKDFVNNYNKYQEKIKQKESLVETASPKFIDYENFAGGTTSLDDLKGKYVYIDVWATWCGPCKKQIPFLKEVEKKYHNKNIEFVSISVDSKSAYDTWKKMVKDKQLGGIQLFAENAFQSQFIQDYAITSIPRFILIDPKGNIVSADAPKPSNPELVMLFDSLKM